MSLNTVLPFRSLGLAFLLVAVVFQVGCTKPPHPKQAKAEDEIIAVLNQQVAAWNRADIPAFMQTYVKGDSLRFSSGGNVRLGWQATYERYLSSYPTPEAMGHLEFEDLEVMQLSGEWAEVHGRYRLTRTGDYGDASGLFTLLLKFTDEGWKILHDHTSAAE